MSDGLGRFYGKTEHTLDSKGRIVIPARFRKILGDEFVITKGKDRNLIIQSEEKFNELISSCEETGLGLILDDDANSVKRVLCENAYYTVIDKNGRALIPQILREKVGINREIVTIGMVSFIEIWSREEYEKVSRDDHEHFGDRARKVISSAQSGAAGAEPKNGRTPASGRQ